MMTSQHNEYSEKADEILRAVLLYGMKLEGVNIAKDEVTMTRKQALEALNALNAATLGNREKYVELDYSKYQNDDDTPLSKRSIKESRKQRMARVVTRNEQLTELRHRFGLEEV